MPGRLLHYATYFDRYYLNRGLALYRSLIRHSPPFRLWVLCLDEETRHVIGRLDLEHAQPIGLGDLEQADPSLRAVKPTRQPVEYYWTCGPAFLCHLFAEQPEITLLTYLDADLYFFGDPTPIYDELADASILIGEHRWHVAGPTARAKGLYNVGLLAFRRTTEGIDCVRRWREQCLEWCFDRIEPGRFGDQKYLETWPGRYAGVRVWQHRGAGVAPWNVGGYRVCREQGRLSVDDEPLLFYHFNRLRPVTHWLYEPCYWSNRQALSPIVREHIYVPYVRELRAGVGRVRAAGGKVAVFGTGRSGEDKLRQIWRMVSARNFLIVTDAFALWG